MINLKLKFIAAIFIGVAVIFSAEASDLNIFKQKKNLFYLAAGAGVSTGDFNEKFPDQTDTIAQNISESIHQNGYAGSFAFGYSRVWNGAYLLGLEIAGEVYSNTADFEAGASSSAFSDSVKIKNDINITLVPGILLSSSLETYLKLGISRAKISDELVSPVGYNPTYQTYSDDKYVTGFAAGIGVKKFLTDHISMFAEYNYRDYGKMNFSDFNNFTATYSHSANIYNHSVLLGIAANF